MGLTAGGTLPANPLIAQALATLQAEYETECRALAARWDSGLRAVTALLSGGGGIDPQLIDWNSPAWEQWKSPAEFSGQIRFGEMKVDLAQLTQQLPQRLTLPGSFNVPALLLMPAHASLLIFPGLVVLTDKLRQWIQTTYA